MTARRLLYLGIFALFALHNDLWLWDDASIVLGLPVGLLYHLLYCVAASALFGALVHWAWPDPFGDADTEGGAP